MSLTGKEHWTDTGSEQPAL